MGEFDEELMDLKTFQNSIELPKLTEKHENINDKNCIIIKHNKNNTDDEYIPIITSCNQTPILTLHVPSYFDSLISLENPHLSGAQIAAIPKTIRVMGTNDRKTLYFVACDLFRLLSLRDGAAIEAIQSFSSNEMQRMPILYNENKENLVEILIVLTLPGVDKLLNQCTSAVSKQLLEWIKQQTINIKQEAEKQAELKLQPQPVQNAANALEPLLLPSTANTLRAKSIQSLPPNTINDKAYQAAPSPQQSIGVHNALEMGSNISTRAVPILSSALASPPEYLTTLNSTNTNLTYSTAIPSSYYGPSTHHSKYTKNTKK
jgi:hypothetical protein